MSLHDAITATKGERLVHRELEKRPWVIKELVEGCCNLCYRVAHFELGNEYESDFVLLHGFSGGWDIHFIELEPPSGRPFNRKGDFGARLNHAAGQVRKWKQFQDHQNKRPYLMTRLRDAVLKKELLWADGREPIDSISWPLTHPDAIHLFHYHVVMGRRQHLSHTLMSRKASLAKTDGFELITYDRVLAVYERQLNDPTYPATV
jgi:hypothetical protein